MESQVCLSLLPGTLQLYYSNPKPEGILGQTIKTAHHIKVENLLFQLSFTKRAESEHFQVGAKCEMCNKGEHFLLSVHWSSSPRLCWLHFGSTSRSAAGKVEFSTRLDLPPPLLLLHLLDDFLWRAGSPGAPFVVSLYDRLRSSFSSARLAPRWCSLAAAASTKPFTECTAQKFTHEIKQVSVLVWLVWVAIFITLEEPTLH